MDCDVEEKKEKEWMMILTIIHNSELNGKLREVIYDVSNHVAQCSCKMFESEGIPCQCVLCVLKGKWLNEISSTYILNRWTKLATSKPIFYAKSDVLDSCSKSKSVTKLITDAWAQLFRYMYIAGQSLEKLFS